MTKKNETPPEIVTIDLNDPQLHVETREQLWRVFLIDQKLGDRSPFPVWMTRKLRDAVKNERQARAEELLKNEKSFRQARQILTVHISGQEWEPTNEELKVLQSAKQLQDEGVPQRTIALALDPAALHEQEFTPKLRASVMRLRWAKNTGACFPKSTTLQKACSLLAKGYEPRDIRTFCKNSGWQGKLLPEEDAALSTLEQVVGQLETEDKIPIEKIRNALKRIVEDKSGETGKLRREILGAIEEQRREGES